MPRARRVLVIQGHPDPSAARFGSALAAAYIEGAARAGHEVRQVTVAALDFPLLKSADDWQNGAVPPGLATAQADIQWAEHLVFFFPLWLGDMPALLKGFLEQVARPGFAFRRDAENPFAAKALKGRSARVVVTMGMPALVYRLYFRAHSVKNLERNILGFVGIAPIRATLIGLVDGMGDTRRRAWLKKVAALGERAA